MKIAYIGSFPPPYGGVTVKNALLFQELSKRVELEKLDLAMIKTKNFKYGIRLARTISKRDGAIIMGTAGVWRRNMAKYLAKWNRKKMNRSLLFVMGGDIPDNMHFMRNISHYGKVYVETESMRKAFAKRGVTCAAVYPNCRPRPEKSVKIKPTDPEDLRVVYFSLISKDKGAHLVCKTAKLMPDVRFVMYGKLDESFKAEFVDYLETIPNLSYMGVFDSAGGDAVAELSKYDFHLFPTMWPHEGVPGVIVETKMAAVPTVASARCYNPELVSDGIDGVLAYRDSAEELVEIIGVLKANPERVDRMKAAAFESAEVFYVDNYVDRILADMREVGTLDE